jgi:tRNA pseudouridine55 synthase
MRLGTIKTMTPGFHLLHKPVGPTSFSLVQSAIDDARRRHPNKRPRICHGGTLDPFAHGLLILLSGPATKLFEQLHPIPKTYETTVRWGLETDNGDLLGKTINTGDAESLTPQNLEEILATFSGWQDQIPHATSNKRVGGERAYIKAHRGETVDMPPSRVYLHEAKWLSHENFDNNGPRQSRLRLVVKGGYYVRSLARDLGQKAGCGAHLTDLHRTTIGPYNDPGPQAQTEVPSRDALSWFPSRELSDQDVGDLRQNRTIPAVSLIEPSWKLPENFPAPATLIRGFHREKFVFLMEITQGWLKPVINLAGGI